MRKQIIDLSNLVRNSVMPFLIMDGESLRKVQGIVSYLAEETVELLTVLKGDSPHVVGNSYIIESLASDKYAILSHIKTWYPLGDKRLQALAQCEKVGII